MMEFDWSEQSPHIRSLYRPWQPGDGYVRRFGGYGIPAKGRGG